jgi:DNA-binding winged helix-turn-helix (wHTH) protein/tetratricopeptide (TPR) repeat protein
MTEALHRPDLAPLSLPVAGFTMDLSAGTLRDAAGRAVPMRPQAWAVLQVLARSAGRVVAKDELLSTVWAGLVVTDSSLAQAVRDARTALGEAGHQVIKTVPRRGYMLVPDAALRPLDPNRPTATTPTDDKPSLAVLAIAGTTDNPGCRRAAQDLADEMAVALARNADLRIASRRASLPFDGTETPSAQVGMQLRSRYLVECSARRDGHTLKLQVTLTAAADNRLVWSAGHSVDNAHAAPAQTPWLRKLAGGVHSAARHADMAQALSNVACDNSVHGLTMRSLAFYRDGRAETVAASRALLLRALELDPDYAPAWAWLGLLVANQASFFVHGRRVQELALDAQAHARRALTLDSDRPVAWRALAFSRLLQRDHAAALAGMRRSADLSPSNADSMQALCAVQFWCGLPEAALATIESALELHECAPSWISHSHGAALWGVGRAHEALLAMEPGRSEQPHHWTVRLIRMAALVETHRIDEAREESAALLSQTPLATAECLAARFPDDAIGLRDRLARAAGAAGIPMRRA